MATNGIFATIVLTFIFVGSDDMCALAPPRTELLTSTLQVVGQFGALELWAQISARSPFAALPIFLAVVAHAALSGARHLARRT